MTNGAPDLWDKLLLRLKSYAYDKARGKGVGVVTLRMVLADGELLAWGDPQGNFFDPSGTEYKEKLMGLLMP